MPEKVYQRMARIIDAYQRCKDTGNELWADNHEAVLESMTDYLPHGSGFDAGSHIDIDASKQNRIVINTSFHHMDENGFYCGWSEHQVIVTPSLAFDFDLRVTGRNVRDIKDYIAEQFDYFLRESID